MADAEEPRRPALPKRCDDCAMRLGTLPNQCVETLMDVIKCTVEGEPFYCHKGVQEGTEATRLCAGFMLLAFSGKP